MARKPKRPAFDALFGSRRAVLAWWRSEVFPWSRLSLLTEFTVEGRKRQNYEFFNLPDDWEYSDEALKKLIDRYEWKGLPELYDAAEFLYNLNYNPSPLYKFEKIFDDLHAARVKYDSRFDHVDCNLS